MRAFLVLLATWLGCASSSLSQDAPIRIDNPGQWFAGHDRAGWIGRRVCVLPAGKSPKDIAADFARDLQRWDSSHPTVGDLVGRSAVILEVWYGGTRLRHFDDRKLVTPDLYWKLRFEDNGEIVWFKDDGLGAPHSLGFWNELVAARRWIGDTVWVKTERFLSAEGEEMAIELQNLEPLRVVAAEWGEFGNYPLKIVLETGAGGRGYLSVRDTTDFRDRWHWSDPRREYPEWTEATWEVIVRRRLTGGMTAEMVRMSWGDPDSTAVESDAVLWFYQGVKERRYTVRLIGGKLVSVVY